MSAQAPTVIVGLGTTGLACARFLARRGVPVAVTDSRPQPPGLEALRAEQPDTPLALGGFDEGLLDAAAEIVVSPGVALAEPALQAVRARGTPLISEIELFCRHATAPIAAITGSNGKSTVTTLLGEMARAAGVEAGVGGNLGPPALELLTDPEPPLYVLELSSFQLEATPSLKARAAVVLNVSADHMDRYPSLEAYAAAKGTVYRGAGVAVANADDPVALALAEESGAAVVRFSLGEPERAGDYGLASGRRLCRGDQVLIDAAELKMAGRHNLANALAALALGAAVGLPEPAMIEALRGFRGLPHRMEWVGRVLGVDCYNDSKGTNVGAALAAIDGLPGPLVLIAGGQGKGADFSPLAAALRGKARAVVLIGEDAGLMAACLAEAGMPVERAADMAAAVRRGVELSRPGDQLLLSPACASFDMFTGYEQRGDAFRKAVAEVDHG